MNFRRPIRIILCLFPVVAHAYELGSHAAITREAFSRSIISDTSLQAILGLPLDPRPFGEFYYDVPPNSFPNARRVTDYEGLYIKDKLNVDKLSIQGWL